MPKVGKIRMAFLGEENAEVYDIWYNSSEKFHIKGLPSDFISLGGAQTFGYPAERELRDAMFHAVQKYKKVKTTEKKVIMFRCAATTHLTSNLVTKGNYSGWKAGVSKKIVDLGFGADVPECSVGIEFQVCIVVNDGNKEYYDIDIETGKKDEHDSQYSKGEGWQEIDYSDERLKFFQGVYESMNKMVLQLSKFFGKDAKEIAQLIDSNKFLLLKS